MYEEWLKLHPNAKIALIIKPLIGITFLVIFIMIQFILVGLSAGLLIFLLILAVFIAILFSIVIVWAIMFYNRYMFRIGGDAVYINRGILWKRNVVIPYERIQHTSTTRGPIDILLGLHILNLFTAGTGSVGARFGGTASAFAAEGSIPGLADPKPFQDAIMAKVRALRGDGLGVVAPAQRRTTPEVPSSQSSTPSAYPVAIQSETQEEMLTELRRIREILEKQGRS
jgi:membrane protein YdbS with pleckstrin-like domain